MKKTTHSWTKRVCYFLTYSFAYLMALILFRIRIKGRDRLPRTKNWLVVARHKSYWDPPLIGLAFGPTNVTHFIARRGLLKNPIFALPVKAFSTTINRDNFGKSDLKKMLTALKNEEIVCILPEGTTKGTSSPKKGAVKMAERTGRDFIPVKIKASTYPPRFPNLFPQIDVIIGHPFKIEDLKRESEIDQGTSTPEDEYETLSHKLMEKIDETE